jgi:hypothetical protein
MQIRESDLHLEKALSWIAKCLALDRNATVESDAPPKKQQVQSASTEAGIQIDKSDEWWQSATCWIRETADSDSKITLNRLGRRSSKPLLLCTQIAFPGSAFILRNQALPAVVGQLRVHGPQRLRNLVDFLITFAVEELNAPLPRDKLGMWVMDNLDKCHDLCLPIVPGNRSLSGTRIVHR